MEELGNGVSSPPVGSRGFFWPRALTATGEGSWQQFVSVPAENFVRVPDTVEFTTAANIYVNGATGAERRRHTANRWQNDDRWPPATAPLAERPPLHPCS